MAFLIVISEEITEKNEQMLLFETRMKLYQSFISLHFNYYVETWNFCRKGATSNLEKLNERSVIFVCRDKSSPYETLLKQCNQQTMQNQRLTAMLTTVYKIVNRQSVSELICDLLAVRDNK